MFYNKMSECLDVLAEFLNADNQGVPQEVLVSQDKYKELKRYLRLQTLDTPKLIQLYYQEMVQIQNTLKTSEYGKLCFRAYYHAKDETLVVEGKLQTVLFGKSLPAWSLAYNFVTLKSSSARTLCPWTRMDSVTQ